MDGFTDKSMWFLVKLVAGIIGVIVLIVVAILVGLSFLIGKAC